MLTNPGIEKPEHLIVIETYHEWAGGGAQPLRIPRIDVEGADALTQGTSETHFGGLDLPAI
jgi:hypothetical protein